MDGLRPQEHLPGMLLASLSLYRETVLANRASSPLSAYLGAEGEEVLSMLFKRPRQKSHMGQDWPSG